MPSSAAAKGALHGRIGWGWLLVWLAFLAYAIGFAPPDDPALTKALVRGTFTSDFGNVDPSISAVFSMLGVVPVLASTFVLRDGATRRLPAWPFALGMFVVGAFSLLPWLAFRGVGAPRPAPPEIGRVQRFLRYRAFRAGIVIALTALVGWAAARGSTTAYIAAFHSTSLVHVMSLDLIVCTLLLFVLVEEERRRAPLSEPALARVVRFVPLFGSALWNLLQRQ